MRSDDWAVIFKREIISACEIVEFILYEKFGNKRDVYLELMNMKQWWGLGDGDL